jgi:hypothetical protein
MTSYSKIICLTGNEMKSKTKAKNDFFDFLFHDNDTKNIPSAAKDSNCGSCDASYSDTSSFPR